MNKKKIFRWIQVLILVYCLIGIGFYYLQDRLFFHPQPLPSSHQYQFSIPHKEVNIPYSSAASMNIIQFVTKQPPKGVVLYFHGNMDNIARYAGAAAAFTKNDYEVWMMDYPGFGKSTGEFTEQMLYDWALTVYKLARARYSRDSIVIYGRSLGTGIAAQLASVRDCRALILETPYYSFPSIASRWLPVYPVNQMVRFKIPTWKYLQEVTAPVTIFHGTDDGVVTYRNARRLMPYLKPADRFIAIEDGGHNNLSSYPLFQQALDSVLSR